MLSAVSSAALGPSALNIYSYQLSLISLGCVSFSSAPALPQAHAGLALLMLLVLASVTGLGAPYPNLMMIC